MNPAQIVDVFLELQEKYGKVKRRVISNERFDVALTSGVRTQEDLDVKDPLVCESLLEHTGHVSIAASYLHPLITRSKEVNLGRVLTMLSVHDIGETIVGDAHPLTKTEQDDEDEYEAALSLIHPDLQEYFKEFEAWQTPDAKFAKAADVFVHFTYDLALPKEIVCKRWIENGFSYEKTRNYRRPLYEWDEALLGVYDEMLERIYAMGVR